YAHYQLPPDIINEGGIIKYRFRCLTNPNRFVTRTRHDDSTSNLRRHAFEQCASLNDHEKDRQLTVAEFARGSTFNPHRLRALHVKWFALHHRPMKIIEDDVYQDILKMFNASIDITSARTASRDIQHVFNITKDVVKKKFQDVPTRKHVALDGWSSPNVMSLLGVVV
ncbi:hypothetical protein K435DRAFT_585079, partial [Dendrothele bispora CBS 962.96]